MSVQRNKVASSLLAKNVTIVKTLNVEGNINLCGEDLILVIDEIRTRIGDLEKLINKQNKLITALWYNIGPNGPGAAEAAESYYKQVQKK